MQTPADQAQVEGQAELGKDDEVTNSTSQPDMTAPAPVPAAPVDQTTSLGKLIHELDLLLSLPNNDIVSVLLGDPEATH